MLGNPRGLRSGNMLGTEAYADGLPDNQAKWLKEVGSKFKGAKIRYTLGVDAAVGGAQPDQEGVHRPDRHRGRGRDRAAGAGARQGDAGRAGPARLLRPLLSRPVLDLDLPARTASIRWPYYKDKPELAMPDFDWDDFSKPLVDKSRHGRRQVDGHPLRHPDLHR